MTIERRDDPNGEVRIMDAVGLLGQLALFVFVVWGMAYLLYLLLSYRVPE